MFGDVILQVDEGIRWLRFRLPLAVLEARVPADVAPVLAAVERAVQERGLQAAGFITYEAAPAFDPALRVQAGAVLPLAWFGLYEQSEIVAGPPEPVASDYELGRWRACVAPAAYRRAIAAIKEHIAAGYTYQVNYTFPLQTSFRGNALTLFARLVQAQRGRYHAFVDTGRFAICSASPELFLRLEGEELTSRPMKGTLRRGRTLSEDRDYGEQLRLSPKNRAENVMIVDMIRNDMGRVARTGSVQVPSLFEVERYPTLLQLTSTVTARTGASLGEILRALFPCASITGAPKVSTMGIIADLEPAPREVYTGAIGYVAPGRRAQFNVAIRTVLIDREADQASYGVGSGIVWESDPDAEYDECLLKAAVLDRQMPRFELLETMRWTSEGGFFLLERHLQRLVESAQYFDFAVDAGQVRRELARTAAAWGDQPQRVRLLVDQEGHSRIQARPLRLPDDPIQVRVGLAMQPVDISDVFLYHKTTHRQAYEAARRSRPDCDDVLLWNERRELTESSLANLVVELDGQLITPPVDCGLLAGTLRAELLAPGVIREGVVPIDALARVSRVLLINSVRGWMNAVLQPSPAGRFQ